MRNLTTGELMADNQKIAKLAEARRRLYCYLIALLVLATGTCVSYSFFFDMDAVVPSWPWLPDFVASFFPGLPQHLVAFPSRYPGLTIAFVILAWGIRRAMLTLKKAEHEYAWQRWHKVTPSSVSRCSTRWCRVVPRFRWFIFVLLIIMVVGILNVWATCQDSCGEIATSQIPNRTDVRGPCRLAPGETVQATMRADSAYNETGVWLEANGLYTAQHIGGHEWRDKDIDVCPTGFRFHKDMFGLPRFWWIEWLRPYPQGEWFQVLGRIDRGKPVFPILDSCNPAKASSFKAPRDGELVLLVNDIIFGNNTGVMTLEIGRQKEGSGTVGGNEKACEARHCPPPYENGCTDC